MTANRIPDRIATLRPIEPQTLRVLLFVAVLAAAGGPGRAWAHAFGQAGVDHYVRITPRRAALRLEHDMHLGEIPSAAVRARFDADHNGELQPAELEPYVRQLTVLYLARIDVNIGPPGEQPPIPLRLPPGGLRSNCTVRVVAGEMGRRTVRIHWRLQADWPAASPTNGTVWTVRVRRRLGRGQDVSSWIFATGTAQAPWRIASSDVPTDTEAPLPPDLTPEQKDRSKIPVAEGATLTCVYGPASPTAAGAGPEQPEPSPAWSTGPAGSDAPGFAIRERIMALLGGSLSPAAKAVVILLCFVWGALHAFTPGHGKAIAGTYLLSTRASYRHAVALGLLVTVTHTAVVLILAVAALILRERFVFPRWLQPLGAVMIMVVGARQIAVGGLRMLGRADGHHDHHHHRESPRGRRQTAPAAGATVAMRDVAAVGVSGGLVPCPASIVLLLLTWQLKLPVLGFTALVSFSFGLALTLIAVGLLAVSGTGLIVRWVGRGEHRHTHRLSFDSIVPVVGGVALLIFGFVMLWRA